jgi:hypothetical protein
MKAVYRVDGHGGLITASLAPANRTQISRFGLLDAVIIAGLLLGLAVVVRFAVAG